jgi:hypothetical protein
VLSGIEHVHAFTRAVSVGNPREFLQAEKEDQEMAEACKRLIKNCIICWNYLYLLTGLVRLGPTAYSAFGRQNTFLFFKAIPPLNRGRSFDVTNRYRQCQL